MEAPEAFGEFPPHLFRVFDREDYARALVEKGVVRFGLLRSYRKIENAARQDSSEGDAFLQIPGDVITIELDRDTLQTKREYTKPGYLHFSGEHVNPIYIYCCSYPPSGQMDDCPRQFGAHVVLIRDPRRFAQQITNALHHLDWPRMVIECVAVR
ncbi:MAG: hypothetical protein KGO52_07000 [Nitrospirota bacterium]|nr:hypothetical protein [Nitrospirota bacterium]